MFKDLPDANIGHITNGVHPTAWMAPELCTPLTNTNRNGRNYWKMVRSGTVVIFQKRTWKMRKTLRTKLVNESRRILGRDVLNPNHLTIGFARRFATYKRGDLIFDDPERLEAI